MVHPDAGVVGDEGRVVRVAVGYVERVHPPRATMKLKRRVIQDMYATEIDRLYAQAEDLLTDPA
jgi:hypothetical protein